MSQQNDGSRPSPSAPTQSAEANANQAGVIVPVAPGTPASVLGGVGHPHPAAAIDSRTGVQLHFPSTDLAGDVTFFEHIGLRASQRNAGNALLTDGRFVVYLSNEVSEPTLVLVSNEARGAGDGGAEFGFPQARQAGIAFKALTPREVPDARHVCTPDIMCELSMMVADLPAAVAAWQAMGWSSTEYNPTNTAEVGWASLGNLAMRVGLYTEKACPHPLTQPTLTWFNPAMWTRIKSLEGLGVKPVWRQVDKGSGKTKDAIYHSPGGSHVFLFSF